MRAHSVVLARMPPPIEFSAADLRGLGFVQRPQSPTTKCAWPLDGVAMILLDSARVFAVRALAGALRMPRWIGQASDGSTAAGARSADLQASESLRTNERFLR